MEIKIYGCELAEALVPYLKKRGVRLTSAVKVGEMSLEFEVQKGKEWITKHAPIWEDAEISIQIEDTETREKTIDMDVPVEITCKKHGSFMMTTNNHLGNNPEKVAYGCPKCGDEKPLEALREKK